MEDTRKKTFSKNRSDNKQNQKNGRKPNGQKRDFESEHTGEQKPRREDFGSKKQGRDYQKKPRNDRRQDGKKFDSEFPKENFDAPKSGKQNGKKDFKNDNRQNGQKNFKGKNGGRFDRRGGRPGEPADDMEIRSYHNDYVAHFENDGDFESDEGRRDNRNTVEREDSGIVIGRNAVRELLKSDRAVDKLLVRRGDREGSIVVLVAEAVSRGIPVVETDRNKMDLISGGAPHQGVIAMAAEKEYVSVDDIIEIAGSRGEAPLIVIADGIADPYNLGALIRCAEGAGAHGLIIPKRHAVGLTPAVTKASAGAIEHLAIAKVSNISSTVEDLKKKGIWTFAAEAGGTPYYETDFSGPAALIFGSEGDGIQENVKKKCDFIVSIPMYGQVNSFNVSTAASVLLCEAARRHRTGK